MTLFPERMKKFELLILKSDADAVLRHLGFAGCTQLVTEAAPDAPLPAPAVSTGGPSAAELGARVESVARFLGIDRGGESAAAPSVPARAELASRTAEAVEAVKGLVAEETALVEKRLALRQVADELASFGSLRVPFSDLEGASWLAIRTGTVPPDRLEDLGRRLQKRAVIVSLGRPGQILALAARRSRWALDTELKKAEFRPASLPPGARGTPTEALAAVEADISEVEHQMRALEERKREARDTLGPELRFLLFHLGVDARIDEVTRSSTASASVQRVVGWVPARQLVEVSRGLAGITRGRMELRSYDPAELPEVRTGSARVPVAVRHGRIARGFRRLVFSYSVPHYDTVDPTPFVAVIFSLLFGIMFGDVGQGLVGLLLGVLITSGRVPAFEQYRRKSFGTAFIMAGAASIVAGFLYGSFFCNETLLQPLTRSVTQVLVGRPLDRIVSLEGFQRIVVFFGVTIGLGVLISSVGLVFGLINTIRRGQWAEALLSKTGVAGAVFFWGAIALAVRIIMGGRPGGVDFVILGLPLAALFLREPLIHLATGHRPLMKEGLFSSFMEGVAEVLESVIYYISGSVSYLRVAAFALAHGVLSTIVILLAGLVGSPPAGLFLSILVAVTGNSIIIVLEGLIVTIQVVRLHYYEFFSKFFTESGEEFSPFILRAPGGSS